MMKTGRLEAFSDGVLAIIITIMVLGMTAPDGYTIEALKPILPVFLTYVLRLRCVAIYWNNHHHLLQAVKEVDGKILWCILNLWLSLSACPLIADWIRRNRIE